MYRMLVFITWNSVDSQYFLFLPSRFCAWLLLYSRLRRSMSALYVSALGLQRCSEDESPDTETALFLEDAVVPAWYSLGRLGPEAG